MKIPERAPSLDLRSLPRNLDEMLKSPEANEIVRRANKEYWPWEEFKYKAHHAEFTPEDLWCWVKVLRLAPTRCLPFFNQEKKPFRFWLPDSAQADLHYIDQSLGGTYLLEGADLMPEAEHEYLVDSLMEEAIASSQLEGAVTTRRVAKEMLKRNSTPKDLSERMILNNYKTITSIQDKQNEPMSIQLLNDLQRTITEGTLDDPATSGRFRTKDEPVHIVDEEYQALYVPPAAEALQDLAQELCEFANDRDQEDLFVHPAIRAIILHFWLAYLHPYVDGNGRTARALFYWYMLRRKYWACEYLSISRIIRKSRVQYQKAFLYTEHDDCDLTYFIVYHLKTLRRAIGELHDYIKLKQHEYQEALGLLKKASWMNYRQRSLIQHALKHPEFLYTIQSHKNSHNVAYQTARADLLALAKRGYLEKVKSARTFQFLVPAGLPKKFEL